MRGAKHMLDQLGVIRPSMQKALDGLTHILPVEYSCSVVLTVAAGT